MKMFDLLQSPAVLLGIAGAVLTVQQNRQYRKAGYASWVAGNSLWTVSGLLTGNLNLVVQFAFFGVLAVQGIRINREDVYDKIHISNNPE
ncbi:hypothetical protein [Methanoplanus limicola]|jgi:hypothetical protein|nr:hypothetical protein [Methanoplanus limicola]